MYNEKAPIVRKGVILFDVAFLFWEKKTHIFFPEKNYNLCCIFDFIFAYDASK